MHPLLLTSEELSPAQVAEMAAKRANTEENFMVFDGEDFDCDHGNL